MFRSDQRKIDKVYRNSFPSVLGFPGNDTFHNNMPLAVFALVIRRWQPSRLVHSDYQSYQQLAEYVCLLKYTWLLCAHEAFTASRRSLQCSNGKASTAYPQGIPKCSPRLVYVLCGHLVSNNYGSVLNHRSGTRDLNVVPTLDSPGTGFTGILDNST